MKKGLAWCSLFTGGAVAAGGTVWAAFSAAAASKKEFISDAVSEFTGNFDLPRFSFNASMAPGLPAMTMDFRNITGDAGQFLTPSMLNTIYSYAEKAGEFTFAATLEQGGMFIVLALLVGANFIYLKNENASLKKEVERIRELANIPEAGDEEDTDSAYSLLH
jgi:hypothetical protein